MRKREFLLLSATAAGVGAREAFGAAGSQSIWDFDKSCGSLMFRSSMPGFSGLAGSNSPKAKEIWEAFRILWSLPRSASPYELALKLSQVSDVNEDGDKYIDEWPVRGNPLIVSFFSITQTLPSGDVTPWCAAFVNFCLAAGGVAGTISAASSSFRSFGSIPSTPRKGDLVVFRNRLEDWRGHVGFFDGAPSEEVEEVNVEYGTTNIVITVPSKMFLLGGNQGNGIRRSVYSIRDDHLIFHSFRRYA